jgi:hypothetical protein
MDDDVLGPIDYLVVEFPGGRFTGEGFTILLDAVDRGVARILDLEFVAKDLEGHVRKVELHELANPDGVDLSVWEGVSSGLLDQSDVDEVGASIEPGNMAGILIYENLWYVTLAAAADRHGARIIGDGRLQPQEILTALDLTDHAGGA